MFQAVRLSMAGRPGVCFIDMPGSLLNSSVEEEDLW